MGTDHQSVQSVAGKVSFNNTLLLLLLLLLLSYKKYIMNKQRTNCMEKYCSAYKL